MLRKPDSTDGASLHRLVSQCPPLDPNSVYCNLLQCTHFRETCVAAELDGELQGFISAYIIPDRPDTLFIWQVAVGEDGRGRGLASQMLEHILQRPVCSGVNWLETTITSDNGASKALFQRLAANRRADLQETLIFDSERHFDGAHDSEWLTRIGPLGAQTTTSQQNEQPLKRRA
jgi:L-2,4-diaminobutyric acid acetyltransferase